MDDIYDFIIIGAGITGITLCKKLREKGYRVLVLEKKSEIGGLCRTRNIHGHILDIGGGHFFYTKYQEVYDYIFSYIPKEEFNYYERVSKIIIGESSIDYPIESNIWQLSEDEAIDYLISIIRNGESRGDSEPHNYEEWIRWRLGDKVCDEYMLPYNTKLWGVSPVKMDIDWLYKIPRVDVKEATKFFMEKKQDKSKFPAHIFFYYPKKGGFETIVDAIALDERKYIHVNEKVKALLYKEDKWIVNDKYKCKSVINTAPWTDIYKALGSPIELENDFNKVKYNRIVVSLYEENYECDWHWRYVPDWNVDYHREFFISNFAEDSKKNGVYRETNINRYKKKNQAELFRYFTDAAYPIPLIGHTQAIENILDYYKAMRLYGVGRWGKHAYMNADVSIYDALQFVEKYEEKV